MAEDAQRQAPTAVKPVPGGDGAARASYPLLGARDLDAPVSHRGAQAVSARHFLAQVQAQAGVFPAHARSIVNLCIDRHDFAVVTAAALLRGLPTLMPPNAMASTIEMLRRENPGMLIVEQPSSVIERVDEASVREVPSIPGAQIAATLLTSGSTGTPVPHARTWASVVLNARAQAQRMAHSLARESLAGLTLVATVPAQHSYGFESSVTLALLGGATLEASRPFFPADIASTLSRVPRPRALVTTPYHLKTLLDSGTALPLVDTIFCATAPLSPQLAQRAEQAMDAVLLEVYGCTEAGQVATRRTSEQSSWTTYDDLRIDARNAVGHETSYWVHGGHVFEPTRLNDELELHDAQRFELLGRSGDLIHVAGKRSSLAYLNHHLNSIAGVVDGVFYMPPQDPAGGIVRPVAFVVAPGSSAAQVARALAQRLDAVFVPKRIVMLDALPHEATGKITSATVQALAREHGVA
jgi:acyl-coenzyme A synthetase/AMP-(fatty) acid ligase